VGLSTYRAGADFIKDFSPKITVAADGQVSTDASKTSSVAQGVEILHRQELVLAPFHSPFPQASLTQKTAPVDLVQDQNGVVTEPASSSAERTLSHNSNITAATNKRPLTPTQYRFLVGKKPGIEHLTEDKLAELSKQTQGYMDSVVDQFRKSKEQNLAQHSAASDRVPLGSFQAPPSFTVCSSLSTDGGQESNEGMSIADGTTCKTGITQSKNGAPIRSCKYI